ncbi:MAG: hypothetical protein MZV64_60385 [Ignavibacteriales bacterium]|nr:hypothetical protein [Ignavibacteriales bacterium]
MVDEYESTDTKMTVRQGFRIGWSRTSWRLFLINLIVNLPAHPAGTGPALCRHRHFLRRSRTETWFSHRSAVIAMIGVVFLVVFVVVDPEHLPEPAAPFRLACSVPSKSLGVRESLQPRLGRWCVRTGRTSALMWLVMIGLGIVWAIASIILFIVTIPVVIVTAAVAFAIVAAIPALLAGRTLPACSWAMRWRGSLGIVFTLPLFFTIAFSPWLLLASWQTVFTSTVWTLTYREIKALPDGKVEVQELPAAS